MMRVSFFRIILVGIFVLGSAIGPVAAAKKPGGDPLEKVFGDHCKKVYADLFKLTEEMRKDLWKSTDFFYWGRLNAQLQTLPNAQLVEIFKPFKSKEEFMTFHDYVQSGAAGSTAAERDMVSELMHMVDDLTTGGADPFWSPAPDRGFAIREAMRLAEARRGYSTDPAYAAQQTALGLKKAQIEVVMRAVADVQGIKFDNSKAYWDRFVRFWSPHYPILIDYIESSNSMQRQLQKMYATDLPPRAAISKYEKELNMTTEEVGRLQALASDTANFLAEVRRDSQTLHGREVSPSNPVNKKEIKIRDLRNRVKAANAKGDESKLARQAEQDMDVVDDVMDKAWDRETKGGGKFPTDKKEDSHLEVRYPQYRRETPERRAAYMGVTETRNPQRSSYDVKKRWTINVEYTVPVTRKRKVYLKNTDGTPKLDSSGQQEFEWENYPSTATVTKSYQKVLDDKLKAYYEEVLLGGVDQTGHNSDLSRLPSPDSSEFPGVTSLDIIGDDIVDSNPFGASASASNDESTVKVIWHAQDQVDRIVADAKKARAVENVFRDQIATATAVTDAVTNDAYKTALKTPGQRDTILKSLEEQMAVLQSNRGRLAEYGGHDATRIQTAWQYDIPQDFKDRNERMLVRFDHMIKRIDHLAAQVRRGVSSLEIQYQGIETFEKEKAIVKAQADKDRKTKIVIGSTTGVATAGTATVYGMGGPQEALAKIRDVLGMQPSEQDESQRRRDPYNQRGQ